MAFFNSLFPIKKSDWDVEWNGDTPTLSPGISVSGTGGVIKDNTAGYYYFTKTSTDASETQLIITDGIAANARLEIDFLSTLVSEANWYVGFVLKPTATKRLCCYLDGANSKMNVQGCGESENYIVANKEYKLILEIKDNVANAYLDGTKIVNTAHAVDDDSGTTFTRIWLTVANNWHIHGFRYKKL